MKRTDMIKKLLMSLLILSPTLSDACIINNYTEYTFNISASNDHWWFVHNTSVGPHQQKEFTIDTDPSEYSYFTISIKPSPGHKVPADIWKIFTHNDVVLDFDVSSTDQIQVSADHVQIW